MDLRVQVQCFLAVDQDTGVGVAGVSDQRGQLIGRGPLAGHAQPVVAGGQACQTDGRRVGQGLRRRRLQGCPGRLEQTERHRVRRIVHVQPHTVSRSARFRQLELEPAFIRLVPQGPALDRAVTPDAGDRAGRGLRDVVRPAAPDRQAQFVDRRHLIGADVQIVRLDTAFGIGGRQAVQVKRPGRRGGRIRQSRGIGAIRVVQLKGQPIVGRNAGDLQRVARHGRRCQLELVPVLIPGAVDRQPDDRVLTAQPPRVRLQATADVEGLRSVAVAHLVPGPRVGLVGQDRLAGNVLHAVIAGARVGPDALGHGRSDGDLVVALQGVDDDRQEIVFRGQQAADIRSPKRISVRVRRGKIQPHLSVERIVAVVVGQSRDQMMALQQAGFRYVVHGDHIVAVRTSVVPDLVRALGILFPFVSRHASVARFEQRPLAVVDQIRSVSRGSVPVEEVQAGSTVELIGVRSAEHAIEPGVLDHVGGAPRPDGRRLIGIQAAIVVQIAIVVVQPAVQVDEDPKLHVADRLWILRPGGQQIAPLAAHHIIMSLPGVDAVIVASGPLAGSAIAPQLVVTPQGEDGVAAGTAVDPVAGLGSTERVVARAAVDGADPVIAPIDQIGDVQRQQVSCGLRDEPNVVRAAQS